MSDTQVSTKLLKLCCKVSNRRPKVIMKLETGGYFDGSRQCHGYCQRNIKSQKRSWTNADTDISGVMEAIRH